MTTPAHGHRNRPWAGALIKAGRAPDPTAHHHHHGTPLPATLRGRATPLDAVARGLRGYPIGVHDPVPAHGVTACLFQARRPFHPERLHDALDEISARVQRSRGHFLAGVPPGPGDDVGVGRRVRSTGRPERPEPVVGFRPFGTGHRPGDRDQEA